ncbi:MAG: hypothetical protein WCW53_05065 [Syntrophales bacterium]|jgi:hypothetical protein
MTKNLDYGKMRPADVCDMCLDGDGGAWQYVYNEILRFYRKKFPAIMNSQDLTQDVVCELLDGGLKKIENKNVFFAFIKRRSTWRGLNELKKGTVVIPNKGPLPVDDEEQSCPAGKRSTGAGGPQKRNKPRQPLVVTETDLLPKDAPEDGLSPAGQHSGVSLPQQMEFLLAKEIHQIVYATIARMGGKCARILPEFLKDAEGYYGNMKELSKILGMTQKNTYKSVTDCIKKLVRFRDIRDLKDLVC